MLIAYRFRRLSRKQENGFARVSPMTGGTQSIHVSVRRGVPLDSFPAH